MFLVLLLALGACYPSPRSKLSALGVPFESGHFVAAARDGKASIVYLFLATEMDREATDAQDRTALMQAAAGGHAAIVNVLLNHGAAPDTPGPGRRTALAFAVAGGHAEVVRSLLKRGADPHAVDLEQKTPFFSAVIAGNETLTAILLAGGADPQWRDTRASLHSCTPPTVDTPGWPSCSSVRERSPT